MAITNEGEVAGSGGGSSHSIAYPSSTTDDLILLFCASGAGSITWDTGVDDFTEVFQDVLASDDPRIGCAYHLIDGDESANFDLVFDSTPGAIWWVVALRGINTADPIGVVGTAVSNTSSSTSAHAGVTTTADGDWALLYGASSEADGSPSSVNNSFTETDDSTIGSGGNGIAQHAATKEITTAGAVGTTTITWGGTDRVIAQMFSVNIDPPVGGTTPKGPFGLPLHGPFAGPLG